MKDRFIERDGLLFMKCEPEPLDIDKHDRCFIQFIQDDTLMGRYNKEILGRHRLESQRIYIPRTKYIDHYHHLRFEVIATHCPEGSSAWALWQMLNGRRVKNDVGDKICRYVEGKKSGYKPHSIEFFLDTEKDGWKIYEEPESKFKVGDWYRKDKDPYTYYQFMGFGTESNRLIMRRAGIKPEFSGSFPTDEEECFIPVSLEPDFTDAKIGDKVFVYGFGEKEICNIETSLAMPIIVHIGGLRLMYKDVSFAMNGRGVSDDEHPILFNNYQQARAYYAELFRKLDEEQR